MIFDEFSQSRTRRTLTAGGRTLRALGLDGPLTGVLAIIVCIGILVVYSASGQNVKMVEHHLANIGIAVAALLALAKLASPQYLRLFAPIAYVLGVLLLIVVDVTGHIGKGAQRWLDIGFMRFQPSEIMKLAVPMMCAWYMHERPLPPTFKDLVVMGIMIAIPTAMIVTQPDLRHRAVDRRLRPHRHAARRPGRADHLDIHPPAGGRRVGGLAFHSRLSAAADT